MYLARGTVVTLQVAYCVMSHFKGNLAWNGFSFHILDNWLEMMKLGTSGILSMFADIGLIEIATFLTQFSGKVSLSVLVINLQAYVIVCAFHMAHGFSTAMLIGYELGRLDKSKIISVFIVAILVAVFVVVPMSLTLWYARYEIVMLFSDDEQVIRMFTDVIWIAVIYMFIDYFQMVLSAGGLVAFGKQRFRALVACTTSYLVGIPCIAYIVLKTGLGAKGVFFVFLGMYTFKLLVYTVRICFLNIDEELKASQMRVNEFKDGENDYRLIESEEKVVTIDTDEISSKQEFSSSEKRKILQKTWFLFSIGLASLSAGALSVALV